MTPIWHQVKAWILMRIRPGELLYDAWRLQEKTNIRGARVHVMRSLMWAAIRALVQLARIPRYVWQGFLLAEELERLHFAPVRRMRLGYGCVIDRHTWLINGASIELGDFVKISAFSSVMAGQNAKVSIGACSIVGPGVLIVSFNHGMTDSKVPMRFQKWDDRAENSIVIGKDVWIGGHSIILPGSKIGDGAVIAAGSIVRGRVDASVVFYNVVKASSVDKRSVMVEKSKHE